MEKLEEHSCGQIEMVENIKAESRLVSILLRKFVGIICYLFSRL